MFTVRLLRFTAAGLTYIAGLDESPGGYFLSTPGGSTVYSSTLQALYAASETSLAEQVLIEALVGPRQLVHLGDALRAALDERETGQASLGLTGNLLVTYTSVDRDVHVYSVQPTGSTLFEAGPLGSPLMLDLLDYVRDTSDPVGTLGRALRVFLERVHDEELLGYHRALFG
nr:hypothetical protein [uncultured Pseudogulbenkiania sp.]